MLFKHLIVIQGCYVAGLYLEGARWDLEEGCLRKSHPKVLITELPIMHIIPVETHRLNLLVSASISPESNILGFYEMTVRRLNCFVSIAREIFDSCLLWMHFISYTKIAVTMASDWLQRNNCSYNAITI